MQVNLDNHGMDLFRQPLVSLEMVVSSNSNSTTSTKLNTRNRGNQLKRQTWTSVDYEAIIASFESGLNWKKIASKKGIGNFGIEDNPLRNASEDRLQYY
jgi:hypothetical protein